MQFICLVKDENKDPVSCSVSGVAASVSGFGRIQIMCSIRIQIRLFYLLILLKPAVGTLLLFHKYFSITISTVPLYSFFYTAANVHFIIDKFYMYP